MPTSPTSFERGTSIWCVSRATCASSDHGSLAHFPAAPGRILNIHPSLLPAFPGLHAQQQALEHGVKVSGATVHLVTDGLDDGPIVLQAPVPVNAGDTVEQLSGRILVEEHRIYPDAIQIVLNRGWAVIGRRFVRLISAGE